jgi:acylphosphatase
MERVRYVVRGEVQGVGFRAWTAHKAAGVGVRGTVRNLADGGVEVVAEGTAEQLAALRSWLERGPRHSTVRGVEENAAGDGELPARFSIIR